MVADEHDFPPQSVVIESVTDDAETVDVSTPVLLGTPMAYYPNQPLIPVDDKPPYNLLWISLLVILLSTLLPILLTDTGFDHDDVFCFVLCNGNATGLIMLGIFGIKYAGWKKRNGGNIMVGLSTLTAIFCFVVAAVFLFLYSLYASDEYFGL